MMTFEDTGSGINPEIFPRLFTKFSSKSFSGTGLGLYISKKLMGVKYGLKIIMTRGNVALLFQFTTRLNQEKLLWNIFKMDSAMVRLTISSVLSSL